MASKNHIATDSKQHFTGNDDGHVFECDCGFTSSGWPTKKAAQDRAQQHKQEHLTGELMENIDVVLARHTKERK